MTLSKVRRASGQVFRVDRKRGPVWFAKYRLPDGRQVQKRIGSAWTQCGRPAEGTSTKRTAEAWARLLAGGSAGARARGDVATGRDDLPPGNVHWAAAW